LQGEIGILNGRQNSERIVASLENATRKIMRLLSLLHKFLLLFPNNAYLQRVQMRQEEHDFGQ
jgi:hypothetical protein